jgi:aminopeptidase N
MLRDLVGEATMREILHEYYQRHGLQHVAEADLRRVAEDVSGRELDWFFRQWFHTTDTLDYGIGDVSTQRVGNRWRTRVEVLRLGEAWMPVRLRVGDQTRALTSRATRQVLEVTTAERPAEAVLDPDNVLLDLDVSNNRKEF